VALDIDPPTHAQLNELTQRPTFDATQRSSKQATTAAASTRERGGRACCAHARCGWLRTRRIAIHPPSIHIEIRNSAAME